MRYRLSSDPNDGCKLKAKITFRSAPNPPSNLRVVGAAGTWSEAGWDRRETVNRERALPAVRRGRRENSKQIFAKTTPRGTKQGEIRSMHPRNCVKGGILGKA